MNRTTLVIVTSLAALALYALRDASWLLILIIAAVAAGVWTRRGRHQATLRNQLQSQFARGSERGLGQALAQLPLWPISERITTTAYELLALRRGIGRARAEGVPASLVERYQRNTAQAADTLWQLASKVDAMAQNHVAYSVVAAMLEREDQRLAQLQASIREAHEGIAVVIAAGIQSDTLQTVEADLSALSQALKTIETARG